MWEDINWNWRKKVSGMVTKKRDIPQPNGDFFFFFFKIAIRFVVHDSWEKNRVFFFFFQPDILEFQGFEVS